MKKSILLVSAAVIGLATPAYAQDAPQAEEVAEDSGDIIVTATRREQALSDVPIAVSAVSGEALANTGATDIRALNQLAPSLLVSGATSEVNFTARIRGIGTVGENPGLESSVGLFIDGVYRSRTGVGLSELGDIERVEVLRGPQGTLFGRNSTAGLINIVTKGPDTDGFSGGVSATYGNYDYLRIDGNVNAPLGDTAAVRIDGVWQQRDGFIKNATPGEADVNDRDRFLVRSQLKFEPSADLTVRLIADYSERNELCCGAVFQAPIQNLTRSGAAGGVPIFGANTLFPIEQTFGANIQTGTPFVRRTATTPGFNYISDTKDWGVSGEVNWDLGGAKLTYVSAYRDYKNTQGQDSDFNALDILRRTALDRRFRLFTQELRLQGEAFDGRLDWLVGGYFANEKLNVSDDIKYGNDYERFANCVLADTFARAIATPSLVSTAGPGCMNTAVATAVVGNALIPASVRTPVGILSGLGVPGFAGFDAVAAAIGQPTLQLNGTGVVANSFAQKSRNYAFFTHNVFDIIEDKLSLTLGARYTNERKTLNGSFNTNNALCGALRNSPLVGLAGLPCVVNGTAGTGIAATDPFRVKKEDQITGTAVLSFKPTDDLMVYASYSKGYKAGGFNLDTSALDAICNPAFDLGTPTTTQIPSCATRLARPANQPGNGRPEAADLQFAPEKVDSYEIGLKYDGPGIDVNVALFDQRYENYQLNTFNGINFEVTNIQACKDDLAGGDTDGIFSTGACPANRLKPGVRSKGFEIEAFISPIRRVNVNLGMTYSDTKYSRNLVGTGGTPLSPALFQLPGRQVSNAARYIMTGGIGYMPEIGTGGMSGLIYLDFRYQSDINTGSDLDLEKIQDGFLVMNGRVGLFGADKRWGVELWGQNLLNKKYQQISADAPLQGGGTYRTAAAPAASQLAGSVNQLFISFPGEPRTYGVTVKYKF
jgi:outer membrane receptor protein involved in Fe transport